MVGIDLTRPPHGERAARALVDAVVANDDRMEHHYLEVKSALDIHAKRDQAKLAKFILGAANRMPDKASTAFSGYAVMVIGASSGSLVGVPPLEVMDVEKVVLPYLGADGPKWDLVRVAVPDTDNEVLLLVVDPPAWGQPPFVCQKEGGEKNELRDGAIYIRAAGQTRDARSDELSQLFRRGSTASAPAVDVEVRILGTVASVDWEALNAVLDEYVEARRAELLLALELSMRPASQSETPFTPMPGFDEALSAVTGRTSAFQIDLTRPETRSKDDYHREIDRWEAETRSAWPHALQRFLGGVLPGAEIEVANSRQTFFEDLVFKIHLEGDVSGIGWVELEEGSEPDLDLPPAPRPWGPHKLDLARLAGLNMDYMASPLSLDTFGPDQSRTSWRNSGSVDMDFELQELRPLATEISEDLMLVLVCGRTASRPFQGTWHFTARSHHSVYSGELSVDFQVLEELPNELRKLLGLPCEGGSR